MMSMSMKSGGSESTSNFSGSAPVDLGVGVGGELIIPGNEISEADGVSSISPSTPPASRSGSRFGTQRTFSSYSFPSTVRSLTSTDSGIHMPEVVRAVTDPRSIVKFSAAGNVISGTLEGLVGRLVNNFSEYFTVV